VVLAGALIVLAVPAAVGWVAERETSRLAATLAASQPGVSVLEREFRRGWWRSRGVQLLRLDPDRLLPPALGIDPAALGPLVLRLESVYLHGPLPEGVGRPGRAVILTRISQVHAAGERLLGDVVTRLSLTGEAESRLEFASLAVDFDGRYGGVAWSGGTLLLNFDALLQHVSVEGRIEPLQLRGVEGSLRAGPGRLEGAFERVDGLWTGSAALDVAQADAWTRRAPRSRTLASDLRLEGQATLLDNRAVLAGAALLSRVSVLGRESRALEVRLRARDLEPSALRGLGGLWREAVRYRLDRAETLARLEALGQDLLAAGLAVEMDTLQAELHYGRLEGRFALRLPPRTPGTALLRHPDAELETSWRLPEGLVTLARTQAQLQAPVELLLQSGVLRREPGAWALQLRYRDGLLVVHGVPWTLPLTAFGEVTAR
jgi:hypothetical protein